MEDNQVLGIITDGDIRRGVEKFGTEVYHKTASELMNPQPKEVLVTALAVEGFQLMESNKISQLLVRDENNAYLGIVHIHDLLSEGIS
jgi:arabinose-5-phosphate isomerase